MKPRLHLRALTWLYDQRWLLAIFVAALVVRWHWNSVVHPPGDYVYSDMNGYVQRAHRLLSKGLEPHEYSSFFPYGTHWIVAGLMKVFGKDNYEVIGQTYALMGALTVALGYAVARRASFLPQWVAPAVGLVGVFYYPHVSLGGYILSEVPFAFFMMATMLFLLRMIDHGRYPDAVAMGVCGGLAMIVRPQMLLAMAFVGVYWIIRRKAMPRVRLTHWVVGFVPVVLMLGFSSWLLHHNTGRRGLLSENGSFNLVFGRCHNEKIQSMPDGEGHGKVHFRPPPYLQLNNTQRKREAEGLEPAIKLDPAISDTFEYKGYIGDKAQHMEYIRECWRRTGLRKQLSYSWTNVILLWRHNIPWPDSGRAQWRTVSRWWTVQHRALFAIPALIGLISLVMRRRFIKQAMVALQLAGLLLLASIFFGGIRHRTPYDYLIIFLALETYAFAGLWLGKLALQRLGRWSAARKGGSSGQNSSSS